VPDKTVGGANTAACLGQDAVIRLWRNSSSSSSENRVARTAIDRKTSVVTTRSASSGRFGNIANRHSNSPREWQGRIGKIPVVVAD